MDSCRALGRRVPRDTIRFEGGEVLVTLERDFSGESCGTNLTAEAREYVGGEKWKSQLLKITFESRGMERKGCQLLGRGEKV